MAKRQPPRPKSTANLPPGLAKYWAAKGVPSKASSSSSKSSSGKKASGSRKRTGGRKKTGRKSKKS